MAACWAGYWMGPSLRSTVSRPLCCTVHLEVSEVREALSPQGLLGPGGRDSAVEVPMLVPTALRRAAGT